MIPILSLVAELCFGTTRVIIVVTQLTKQSKYVAVWLDFAMHGLFSTVKYTEPVQDRPGISGHGLISTVKYTKPVWQT